MALQLGVAAGYDDVFWTNVLKKVESLIEDSTDYGHIYISPEVDTTAPQSIRLWGNTSSSVTLKSTEWIKRYEVEIAIYMISKIRSDGFYDNFFQESERVYQIMADNNVIAGSLGWFDGSVTNIEYNQLTGNEDEIDGLYKAGFNFSCLVNRITTATIII